MKKNNLKTGIHDKKDNVVVLKDKKIEKVIKDETDPECHEGLNWMIDRFKDDTLTGK